MERMNAQPFTAAWPQGSAENLILTQERIDDFFQWQKGLHRAEVTMERYRRDLEQLYQWLPEDKEITQERLAEWKQSLLDSGYAGRSVNTKLSAVNSFLTFSGRRELQLLDFEKSEKVDTRLSREEYLRLLQAAKLTSNQRMYLMIKIFGTMGLPIQHLDDITVEAVKKGLVKTGETDYVIPDGLREELEAYAAGLGRKSGPVFLTRSGDPLNRSTVTCLMKRLGPLAQVDEEKITPRCLKKMCQETREEFQQSVEHLVAKAYAELLEREQQKAGWE